MRANEQPAQPAQRAHPTPTSGVILGAQLAALGMEWARWARPTPEKPPPDGPGWARCARPPTTHHSPPANNDNTINTYQKPPRTCIPIHIPKNRFPCPPPSPANIRYSFNAPSYPLERNASIACPNAPTPGKIKLSARSMSAIEVTGVIE